MSYSVIIPSCTTQNMLECVASIGRAKETSRVIVVDDGIKETRTVVTECSFTDVDVISGVKPFVFARNINLGIAAAGDDDVILLNDDTRLLTPHGFGLLSAEANAHPEYGIISAGITDAVGNLEQLAQPGTRLRPTTHHTLVFVAVYVRRHVLIHLREPHNSEKWLDERFVDYGYDDDDACERVRQMGLKLGIYDGCVIEHGKLPSTYRSGMRDGVAHHTELGPNLKRFIEKWGFSPGQGPSMKPPQSAAPRMKV